MSLEPQEILSVAVPAGIALLGLIVGLLVSRSVVSRLAKTAEQTRSVAGNVVIAAVRWRVFRWNGVFCNVSLGEAVIESVGGSKNPSLLPGIA